ncbi:MAG: hypothetical protein ACI38A_05905 [Candidatus Ornithomonoglobus sp.]
MKETETEPRKVYIASPLDVEAIPDYVIERLADMLRCIAASGFDFENETE